MKSLIPKWPPIYERQNKGGSKSYIVDLGQVNGGKRKRPIFKTKEEAETVAQLARDQRREHGLAVFTISSDLAAEAQQAQKLLSPFGIRVIEAARHFIKVHGRYANSPSVSQVVEKLIAEAKHNKRRPRTLGDLKSRFASFEESFGDRRLSEITIEEVKEWNANPAWSPRTRANYLTKASQLYNFAKTHQYVEHNIIENIQRPNVDPTTTEIFSANQAENLLKHAEKSGLLAYVALGLFGGLRSAELQRMSNEAINLEEGIVIVGAEVAKKRSMRHVTINSTLRAWLEKCDLSDPKAPLVAGRSIQRKLDALKKATGITKWPNNGLRHSFASYHLACYGDAKETALQLGHRDMNVLHLHYKALVTRGEAAKYWSLLPEAKATENSPETPTENEQPRAK